MHTIRTTTFSQTMEVEELNTSPLASRCREIGFILDLGGKVDRSWAAIDTYKQILHDVQRYYPERLGFACVQHLGMMSKLLVNVMWPFVE